MFFTIKAYLHCEGCTFLMYNTLQLFEEKMQSTTSDMTLAVLIQLWEQTYTECIKTKGRHGGNYKIEACPK